MPLLKRKRVLAAKIETTSGTLESVTASNATFVVFDCMIQPTVPFRPRPSQGSFSYHKGALDARMGVATFRIEVKGDDAGGVPAWASTFLPACGWVNAGGTFSPATEPPGSNVKTLTIASYQDGMLKRLRGAAGNAVFTFVSGQVVDIAFTFTGVYQAVTDASILAPTYTTVMPIRYAAATTTVGGSAPGKLQQVTIDLGNSVIMRDDPTASDGSGYFSGLITDRNVTGSMNPESQLVATDDVFGEFLNGTEQALNIVLDNGVDTVTFNAPKMQRTNVQEGDRNGLQTDEVTFQCNKSAAAGNDELTIAFASSS